MLLEYAADQVHIEMVLYMLIDYTYFLSLCIFYLCNVIKYYYIVCIHASIRMGYTLLNVKLNCLVVYTSLDEKIR